MHIIMIMIMIIMIIMIMIMIIIMIIMIIIVIITKQAEECDMFNQLMESGYGTAEEVGLYLF